MTNWILTRPYIAGAIFYGLLIAGVLLFMRGARDDLPDD